jgi:selenocysteine lyase/cysteine desulfurase
MAALADSNENIRAQFPALKRHQNLIFGDNAGGSQILQDAIHRITDYLINGNAQMGSDYMRSSTERAETIAQKVAVKLFNAAEPAEIVFGASSTQNLENLARGLENDVKPGDEIIITGEHEGRPYSTEIISGY